MNTYLTLALMMNHARQHQVKLAIGVFEDHLAQMEALQTLDDLVEAGTPILRKTLPVPPQRASTTHPRHDGPHPLKAPHKANAAQQAVSGQHRGGA